jgi:hypothetical protein
MTVALAGTGGDEVFGGYASFVDIPRAAARGAWLPFGNGAGPARGTGLRASARDWRAAVSGTSSRWHRRRTRWGKCADVAARPRSARPVPGRVALFTREYPGRPRLGPRAEAQGAGYGFRRPSPPPGAADRGQRAAPRDLVLELSGFVGERPVARHRRRQHGRRLSRCAFPSSTTS